MYDLPEMRADNARFGEALRGLLRAHDWGLITVEFSEREDGIWLSVEDTGIGMSEAVLTGSLLDFGAPPGWSRDFPASRRKEWFPLDQFGIGFFSVFMLGDRVRVITRRRNRAETDALLLEFRDGINSRRFLSTPTPDA
jgi:HSP90 family molecular chaperone